MTSASQDDDVSSSGGGIMFAACLSVCLFLGYQTWEHNILKANELISMRIGRSCRQGKHLKRSTLGVKDQCHTRQK